MALELLALVLVLVVLVACRSLGGGLAKLSASGGRPSS